MSQKFPVNSFKSIVDISEFDQSFGKCYNKESDTGYFLEVDIQYPEYLYKTQNDLPFYPVRMKSENIEKLVVNLNDKAEHVVHIRNLKQALNHRQGLKKV